MSFRGHEPRGKCGGRLATAAGGWRRRTAGWPRGVQEGHRIRAKIEQKTDQKWSKTSPPRAKIVYFQGSDGLLEACFEGFRAPPATSSHLQIPSSSSS